LGRTVRREAADRLAAWHRRGPPTSRAGSAACHGFGAVVAAWWERRFRLSDPTGMCSPWETAFGWRR
jgi:hypothetical protein